MRVARLTPLLVLSAALGACTADPKLDDALRQDLSLATSPYMPQQFVSPIEGGYQTQPQYVATPYGPQPLYTAAPPMRQATTVRRTSSTRVGSTGTRTVIRKNTKRDAAIGAAAGAAIGAVTSAKRDRLKGAVIGAAAGAVLGGVIGNNVDLTKIQIPR